jgi:hypothetical protein
MACALETMAYRPHAALASRATSAAAARPRLVGRVRRAPAGRSLALRVEMRAAGGRLRRVEGGGWRRVEEEGPGQEGGGTQGPGQSRGRSEAPLGANRGGGRGVSGSGSPTRRDPAPSRHASGSAGISNKQLNSRISGASSVEAILDLVDQHHETFNDINVATAVTRIAKLAKVTRDVPLASDGRYAKLMGLVVQQLPSFGARGVVNVFSGLAILQVECGVAADADLLVKLGAAFARVAPNMDSQGVANTLNACSKLEDAAAEMPRSLRDALAEVAERVAPDMNAQEVANTLTAYSKL